MNRGSFLHWLSAFLVAASFVFGNVLLAQDQHSRLDKINHYTLQAQGLERMRSVNSAPPAPDYDLSLVSIEVVDGYYIAGDIIEPLFFIENLGTETSPQPVQVGFYLSTDETITVDDFSLGALNIASLTPGKKIGGIVPIPLPGPLADGSYYFGAIISLEDQDTDNNTNHDPVAISIDSSRTTGPDLALLLADSPNGLFKAGDVLDIIFNLDNIGDRSSNSFTLKWYASTDTTITAGDILLNPSVANSTIQGMPPSAGGITVEYLDPLPGEATIPDGDYFIGGIIEPSVAEDNSGNHVAYDPEAIKISNNPEIRVEPLSLDFIAEQPEQEKVSTITANPVTITTSALQGLRQQAAKRGRARVIVGLDSAFVPEGKLKAHLRSSQRQNIQAAGSALLSDLAGDLAGPNFNIRARYQYIPFMALTVDSNALEHLARSPRVTSIEEDSLHHISMASSLQVIGAPVAWAEGFDGTDWTVAILDTGVDKSHPWFTSGGAKVVSEACYSSNEDGVSQSWCPGGENSSVEPGSGVHCDIGFGGCDHGTHVAGIVAGNDGSGPNSGVARGADIIAMQVFTKMLTEDDCGTGEEPCLLSTSSDQIKALERVYALRDSHNIAAVNMSLGGGRFFDSASCDLDSPATKAAIDQLRSVGIATVVAAGNDGFHDSISSPACISSAISVGATTDSDKIAIFSNIYPDIHLLAPGVSIDSSVPGGNLGRKQGTSMSSPHVAGAWGVLKQEDPAASVGDILAALTDTGTLLDDQRVISTQSGDSLQVVQEAVTSIPRINLDQALQQHRTSFTIFNDGGVQLNITAISPNTAAPWIDWTPKPPFSIPSLGSKVVKVDIDFDAAPAGESTRRLGIESNDASHSPYPGGVDINVNKVVVEPKEVIYSDGFEEK